MWDDDIDSVPFGVKMMFYCVKVIMPIMLHIFGFSAVRDLGLKHQVGCLESHEER